MTTATVNDTVIETPVTPIAWRDALRRNWPPLVAYAFGVAAHLLVLGVATGRSQWGNLRHTLTAWDGNRYVDIAQHGYPPGLSNLKAGSNLAFLPLYPATIRLTHWVTRLSYPMAAIVVANLALLIALFLAHKLLRRLLDPREAVVAVVLIGCAQPTGIVLSMAYSESVFLVLATGALLALREERWLTAGTCAALAGLTRPSGVAVTVAVITWAAVITWRARSLDRRVAVATVISTLGTPIYLMWVAIRGHSLTAWFTVQQVGWGTHWDNGASTWRYLSGVWHGSSDWTVISMAMIVVLTALVLVMNLRSTWLPMAIYAVTIVIIACGQSNFDTCKPRMLMPAAIVLAVPVARSLARLRQPGLIVTLIGVTAFSAWYGASMLITWRYGI